MKSRLKLTDKTDRSKRKGKRKPWPPGFRDKVFDGRCSADGKTRCRCCGRALARNMKAALDHNLTADLADYVVCMQLCHIIARSLGGPDVFENIWPGCEMCNLISRLRKFCDFAIEKGFEMTKTPEFIADHAAFQVWSAAQGSIKM